MTPAAYALLERLHGHLGWLGLAVLLHPVLWLRRGGVTARVRLTLGLSCTLILAPSAMGWWLYPTYRIQVKPALAQDHRGWALAFELKEHLAFCCLALVLCGAAAILASPGAGRRAGWWLLLAGWLCGAAVGALGVGVAGHAHPGW